MRNRLIVFLVFGAVLAGIGEWDAAHHRLAFNRGLNDWWLRFCVGNAGDRIGAPAVTLVTLDDEYEPGIGDSLTRLDYAAILGFVGKLDPKTVAFEPSIAFDEKNPLNQTALQPLKEATLRLPKLSLGSVAENGQPPAKPSEKLAYPVLKNVEGDLATVTPFTRTVAPPDAEMLANGEPAVTEIELAPAQTADGSQLIPIVARQGDALVPSLVLHALANHAGVPLDQIAVSLPPAAKSPSVRVGDRYTIPIDPAGRMKLYEYSGLRRRPADLDTAPADSQYYPAVSAFHLTLTGADDPDVKKLIGGLQDEFDSLKTNLVLVADDHRANRRLSLVTGEAPVSRGEVIARAVATVQTGRYIERWPAWGRWLAVAAIAVVAIFAFRHSGRRIVLLAGLGALLFFGLNVAVFRGSLAWAPPFAPIALFLLMIVVGLILHRDSPHPGDDRGEDDVFAGKAGEKEESRAEDTKKAA